MVIFIIAGYGYDAGPTRPNQMNVQAAEPAFNQPTRRSSGGHQPPPVPPNRPNPPARPTRPTKAPSQDGYNSANTQRNSQPQESYEMQPPQHREPPPVPASNRDGYERSSGVDRPSRGYESGSNHASRGGSGYESAGSGYDQNAGRGGGYDQGHNEPQVRPRTEQNAAPEPRQTRSSGRIAGGQRYGGQGRQSFDQGYDQ